MACPASLPEPTESHASRPLVRCRQAGGERHVTHERPPLLSGLSEAPLFAWAARGGAVRPPLLGSTPDKGQLQGGRSQRGIDGPESVRTNGRFSPTLPNCAAFLIAENTSVLSHHGGPPTPRAHAREAWRPEARHRVLGPLLLLCFAPSALGAGWDQLCSRVGSDSKVRGTDGAVDGSHRLTCQ